jgi:hypothetical protein
MIILMYKGFVVKKQQYSGDASRTVGLSKDVAASKTVQLPEDVASAYVLNYYTTIP